MEKGFLHWKADLLTEFDPFETGLERFVRLEKDDFIGKAALANHKPRRQLITLIVETKDAPAHPGASIMAGGKVVGTISSGDWGHRVNQNIALGFVDIEFAAGDAPLTIDILGVQIPAKRASSPLYDPENTRLKS